MSKKDPEIIEPRVSPEEIERAIKKMRADDNVEIGFKPSELLGESAGNFTSKIRFTPDAGGAQSYTIDNGNFAASQQEVINTSLTLIDGQTYAVEYQIFDAAGNCSCDNVNTDYEPLQRNFIYDLYYCFNYENCRNIDPESYKNKIWVMIHRL